ncbi:hypothetical protein ACFX2J_019801 [Malus domestica]
MNSDGKPQGLHLRPHKGTHLGSFYSLDSGPTKAPLKVNSVLLFQPCPKSLAGRDLPDETYPTTPRNEAEARQQPSTGANLQGSYVLVGQETSPAEIPAKNTSLSILASLSSLSILAVRRKQREPVLKLSADLNDGFLKIGFVKIQITERAKFKLQREQRDEMFVESNENQS